MATGFDSSLFVEGLFKPGESITEAPPSNVPRVGSANIRLRVGSASVGKIYLGTVLLWSGNTAPTVPTLPAGAKFVSTTGADTNAGTEAAPWGTIEASLGKMTAGGTLVVRGGTYREFISSAAAGTAAASISIIAYPGETPIIDGAYAALQTVGNSAWTLHDSGTQTYRTTATTYPASTTYQGSFVSNDGETYLLHAYRSLADLMSTTYQPGAKPVDPPTGVQMHYRGPGFVRHTDGSIYIRLQNLASPRNAGVPAAVTDARVQGTPASNFNPASYKVNISSASDLVALTGSYLTFDGLTFANCDRLLFLNAAHHISFLSCNCLGYRRAMRPTAGAHHINVRWGFWDSCFPPYTTWSEIKVYQVSVNLETGYCAADANTNNIRFEDVHFGRHFDGIQLAENGINEIRILHCEFDFIFDEIAQYNGNATNLEFGWNLINGPGIGFDGGSVAAGQEHSKWFHHNIVDVRRDEWGNRVGATAVDLPDWRDSHFAMPQHSVASTDVAPLKIYNNTFFIEPNVNNYGAGRWAKGSTARGIHEVYNDIVVQFKDREVEGRGVINSPGARYDFNLYWRTLPGATFPFLNDYPGGDYASLAAWHASAGFASTTSSYAPGYEANSRQADPGFGVNATYAGRDYRPNSSGPAATGGKDLSTLGWPGTAAGTIGGAIYTTDVYAADVYETSSSTIWLGAVDPDAASGLGDVGIRPRP